MKLKATKREIKEYNNYILRAGYCEMDYLLSYEEPFAYSAGVYGWSCDYYKIDNVVISTGYAPLDNKNINIKYTTIKLYNELAINKTKEEKRALLDKLIRIAKKEFNAFDYTNYFILTGKNKEDITKDEILEALEKGLI